MTEEILKRMIRKKELELNALLEITQAINANLPAHSLFKIFNFTVRGKLKLTKIALYVWDSEWSCKVHFGTNAYFSKTQLEDAFLSLKDEKDLSGNAAFGRF